MWELKLVMSRIIYVAIAIMFLNGCVATPTHQEINKPTEQKQISKTKTTQQGKGLKRKVAIARFSNETKHGNSFLLDDSNDRIGKQASDILSSLLVETGKFILLERSDLDKILKEKNYAGIDTQKIGADYLIIGSVTEFGRKNVSDVGLFNRNKKQIVRAAVTIRLLDVKTGQIIYSEEGTGEATVEAATTFGLGDKAGYDATLDDKALRAAISQLTSNIFENLLDSPWKSYILAEESGSYLIAGGKSQGIKEGNKFDIMTVGRKIKNPQTGIVIELPGKMVARVKISSLAGSGEDEISIGSLIEGSINPLVLDSYVVIETKK
jgi:curli biogenesis system outer membrane secretion channel CsgG